MALATKADLRKEFLTQRNALDPAERAKASSLIRQRIFQHPAWKKSSTILCYVSFGSEVDTHALLQEAIRFKKHMVVPLHDPAKVGTFISELRRFGDLGPSHRGVLQLLPEAHHLVDPATIELALIPGIAFDRKGGRVGFGGGYFDRLLPGMTQATFMALAFESQLTKDAIPLEAHDVRMHTIVTEKAVMETRRVQ
jgi:5-formyltetrahydrofolate cyclo-ligase